MFPATLGNVDCSEDDLSEEQSEHNLSRRLDLDDWSFFGVCSTNVPGGIDLQRQCAIEAVFTPTERGETGRHSKGSDNAVNSPQNSISRARQRSKK
jgi:hypothetical protein